MSTEQEERIVADGVERAAAVADRVRAAMLEGAEEIDRIRREVLDATGVEITDPSPKPLAVMDVPVGVLADVAGQCRALLAGVELLQPHVVEGSVRTVGAVLKTRVSLSDAAMAVHFLNRSGFFAPSEFCPAPEVGS